MFDSIIPRWIVLLVTLLAGIVLPYAIPLGGPDMVHPARLADPNGAFVRLDGERLYYTHTPGSGDSVVVIHGFGGSTVTWWDTAPALAAAGFDVYALDLLGFGLSDKGWRHDYSHSAQAARVVRFLDEMGIKRAHLVGHSMGGNVAVFVALTYPERVGKLALVAPAIVLHSEPDLFVPLLDLPFIRRWGQVILRQMLSSRFGDILLGAAAADRWMTPELEARYIRALSTPDWDLSLMAITRDAGQNALPGPLSAVRTPVLLLWGTEDNWVPLVNAARLEQQIPNVQRIEFVGAGHVLMHEVPEAFNAALITFLGEGT